MAVIKKDMLDCTVRKISLYGYEPNEEGDSLISKKFL